MHQNVSLFDSIVEAEDSIDVDGSGFKCCDPNEIGGYHSSDEKNGATKMVRYCVKHEWKPNLDGSVSLSEGLRAKFFATLRWADHENSYAQIRKYGNILIKMNPGSMAKAFKLTYRGYISPMPNLSMWPDVEEAPLEPPKRRNTVGKPKKNRRRKPDEGLAPSKSFTKHCKSCGSYRHNKRTVPRLINNHLGCRGTNLKKLREDDTQENKVMGILVNL
ncbi:hypothetical protein QYF36_022006 [Acer negundo]|nr:hypothetical protein QYF36_022006 [Acer negundo]